MRFVTVMAGAASASPHGWGHGSGQRSPPMPALKCPTPRSVVSISTTRLDATQKTNSGKPLRKRPRVHVRHPSQPGPKGTHCSTGFAIRAKKLVVPFSRDMFFPPADCEAEQKLIPNSKFRVVDSLWAHFAMFCITHSERDQIDACIRDLLAEPVD